MLDTIHAALLENGKRVFLTLPKLTSEEIISIWGTVSEFVEKQLSLNKGVLIPGLGTFSFLRQKLEVGAKKFVVRPVFLLSEKLAQIHGLKYTKIFTPGDIPIVKLNFIVLSLEVPFNRETVEGCIRETLMSFSRSIATKQTVEFTFKGIGVLVIRDSKVKMKFFKEFLQTMDGSGNLLKALSNRPGTGDSVLSGRDVAAPHSRSCNVVTFPRIEVKEMETIPEEGDAPSKEKEQSERLSSRKENLPMKRLLSRQPISPAKVTGVSLTEDLEKNVKQKPPPARPVTPVPDPSKAEQEAKPTQIPTPRSRSPSPLCEDHGRAGQEMCYLCMQRAQRSIPVVLGEDKRAREKDEDRILAQYLALKDQAAVQKQQVKTLANREKSQKIAAFNLGIAEAMRNHKNEKQAEAYKSYVFEKRPTSSTPHQKQEEYAQHLNKQLEEREVRERKEKQNQDLIDRLEHVQLAEELAAQRANFLKNRMEQIKCYKRALDTQIKMKPTPLPPFEPDSSEVIFGKYDMNLEKLEEAKKRAQEYAKCQLQAAADRKRAVILSQLVDQRKALDMFQRAKNQWLAEKGARFEKIFQMNLAVRDDWHKSIELKRLRDYEEKLFKRAGDKLLLLDQCANYRRCYQCKKRLDNSGESNVWADTKYIPGSRLIV